MGSSLKNCCVRFAFNQKLYHSHPGLISLETTFPDLPSKCFWMALEAGRAGQSLGMIDTSPWLALVSVALCFLEKASATALAQQMAPAVGGHCRTFFFCPCGF